MVADVFTQTISGKMVSLTNPKPEQIDIHDMVYSLCRINRFNGHTKGTPYSVANHSWFAAKQVEKNGGSPKATLAVLLHDAHEYVTGDITTPVANAIFRIDGPFSSVDRSIKALKDSVDAAICAKLGLPNLHKEYSILVSAMDARALQTERRDLLNAPGKPEGWDRATEGLPFPDEIIPIEPNEMFSLFYRDLTRLVSEVKK